MGKDITPLHFLLQAQTLEQREKVVTQLGERTQEGQELWWGGVLMAAVMVGGGRAELGSSPCHIIIT